MNKTEQDAADALQAFKDAERARWKRAQPPLIVGTFQHFTPEQQQAHIDWLKQHEQELPF